MKEYLIAHSANDRFIISEGENPFLNIHAASGLIEFSQNDIIQFELRYIAPASRPEYFYLKFLDTGREWKFVGEKRTVLFRQYILELYDAVIEIKQGWKYFQILVNGKKIGRVTEDGRRITLTGPMEKPLVLQAIIALTFYAYYWFEFILD